MSDREIETAAAISEVKAILSRVEAEMLRHAGALEQISTIAIDVDRLRSEQERVLNTLHIGNGKPPLVQRVTVLERESESHGKGIGALKRRVNRRDDKKRSDRIALITSLVTALGALALALLS
jgi:hypothetical protein